MHWRALSDADYCAAQDRQQSVRLLYFARTFSSTAMTRKTRWIGLVWLALVLNVLSPVIGYARVAASGSGALPLELCSAAGAHRVVFAPSGDEPGTASFDHAAVPHCVYCPGFASNVALATSVPVLPGFVRAFAYRAVAPAVPDRPGQPIRLAQPRGPPDNVPF